MEFEQDGDESMDNILVVQDLKKSYDKTQALKGVTFSVQSGTCFGLLGPNGAGKSTTMKILTGIVKADGGTADILGLRVDRESSKIRRQVGYVPQNITLYEKLSAFDNLTFFGELYGLKGKQLTSRIREVLEQIGLANREKDAVESFSGGMKRRINIATALLHRPKLLILDEPTVGIDPQSRNHIFEMIRSLKSEGVTVIYSTHYMEEVEALCDDLAIVDQGKVIACGSLAEMLGRYSTKTIYVEAPGFDTWPALETVKKLSRKGRGFVIETDSPMDVMKQILQAATERGVTIEVLETMRSSLESVFLALTGTSLRD